MNNCKNERVVYIRDIVFCVLGHWKSILCVALVFALFLSGYRLLTDMTATEQPVSSDAMEQYQEDKQRLETEVANKKEQLAAQQDFVDNAVFMHLDPYDHYLVAMSFYVDTGYEIQPDAIYQAPDKAPLLTRAYRTLVFSVSGVQTVADALSTDPKYLTNILLSPEPAEDYIFTVTMQVPTQEQAEQLEAAMHQFIMELQVQFSQTLAPHSLHQLQSVVSNHMDLNMVTKQEAEEDRLLALTEELAASEEALANLKEPSTVQAAKQLNIKNLLVMGLLGLFLGGFLAMLIVMIRHIGSNKVYSTRTLADHTGIKVLSCVNDKPSRRGINRWIYKKEGRCLADTQQQAVRIAEDLQNRRNHIGKLLVVGAAGHGQELAQLLDRQLPGTEVLYAASLLSSAQALQQLAACDQVLLVEQCHISTYKAVSEQMELISDYNKQLAGCVLFGG